MKVKIVIWTLATLSTLFILGGGAFACSITDDVRKCVYIERHGIALFDSTSVGDDQIATRNGYDIILRHKEWRNGKSAYIVAINHRWSKLLLLPMLVSDREIEIEPKAL